MAISLGSVLRNFHGLANAMGKKVIASDFTVQIKGYENLYLLTEQCPWPVVTSQGSIEIPSILGSSRAQPQQNKTMFDGDVSFQETVMGNIDQLMVNLIVQGGTFNCRVFEGTPQKYLRYKDLEDCFIVINPTQRNWENRTEVLKFEGAMTYHYYGETVEGNSTDYR